MQANNPQGVSEPELVASGLGWPEGPTMLPDGRLVFVDSYRSEISVLGGDGQPADKVSRFAYTAGAPNACVLGSDGALYVCQNGGTTGPWRAKEMVTPSIQRVAPGGQVEQLITEVAGHPLNGPNDLCFMPDGSLVFSDPGTYNPKNPDPSYIYRVLADGRRRVEVAFPRPVFPNGVAAEPDGSIVWDESYTGHVGRIRPDGRIEDLGRLPCSNPIPDGLKVGADGRLYVTDILAGGIHVLGRDGTPRDFIKVGKATTNCVFAGETLWVTDAGVLATSAEASSEGAVWKLRVPGGGAGVWYGKVGK